MREFSYIISDDLVNGIKPDPRARRGTPYLEECINMKCLEDGLQPYDPLIDPFEGSVKVSFPLPQLFRGKSVTILAGRNTVEYVDTSVTPWQTNPVNLVTAEGKPISFDVNEPWHFVDFGTVWYLFNRDCVVLNDGSAFLNGDPLRAYCFKEIQISTATEHNGRCVFGGFKEGRVWSIAWKEILENIADELQSGEFIDFSDIDQSYVMWSSIGGGDFPLWLFFPNRALFGNSYRGFDNVGGFSHGNFKDTMLYDVIRRNQFGYMKMPFSGEVLAIRKLNSRIIVYGSNGIVGLFPHSSRDADITTYGMVNLSRVGIPRRSFVGGDDNQHIFIDTEGNLWGISGEFSLQKIGYRRELSQLLDQDIAIEKNTYDNRREFYISGKHTSFLLTQNGLSEFRQQVTSYTFMDGGHLGIVSPINDKVARVVTNQIDLATRGIKTVTALSLSFQGGKNVKVAIDYRHNTSDKFSRTEFVPVNSEGNAMLRITGVDFRAVVESEDFQDFELDYIQLRWQSDDRRFVRGTFAAPDQQVGVEDAR